MFHPGRRAAAFALVASLVASRSLAQTALPVTPSVTVGARVVDPCDPRRPCPRGWGLCIRCEAPGDPRWTFSDAPGSPAVFTSLPPPDCARYTFDAQGRPLTFREPDDGPFAAVRRWRYDRAGRVVRDETDEPAQCAVGCGDVHACAAPDGAPERRDPVRWTPLRDGLAADLTRLERPAPEPGHRQPPWSSPSLHPSHTRWEFDARGRPTRTVEDADDARTRYEGDATAPGLFTDGGPLRVRLDGDDGRPALAFTRNRSGVLEETRWTWLPGGWPSTLRHAVTGVATVDVRWTHTASADGRTVESRARNGDTPWASATRTYNAEGWAVSVVERSAGSERTVTLERGLRGRVLRVTEGSGARTVTRDLSCLPPSLWDALLGAPDGGH